MASCWAASSLAAECHRRPGLLGVLLGAVPQRRGLRHPRAARCVGGRARPAGRAPGPVARSLSCARRAAATAPSSASAAGRQALMGAGGLVSGSAPPAQVAAQLSGQLGLLARPGRRCGWPGRRSRPRPGGPRTARRCAARRRPVRRVRLGVVQLGPLPLPQLGLLGQLGQLGVDLRRSAPGGARRGRPRRCAGPGRRCGDRAADRSASARRRTRSCLRPGRRNRRRPGPP